MPTQLENFTQLLQNYIDGKPSATWFLEERLSQPLSAKEWIVLRNTIHQYRFTVIGFGLLNLIDNIPMFDSDAAMSALSSLVLQSNNATGIYNLGILCAHHHISRQAIAYFALAASWGCPEAQFEMGYFYEQDVICKKNEVDAFKWFEKAAAQNHVLAQDRLGVFYKKGNGVTKDYNKAKEWYKKAARQDYREAQCHLGLLYGQDGATQNYTKAAYWFEKAAEQGVTAAQHNLAGLYHQGNGVPKNQSLAMMWYEKAANQGSQLSQNCLAVIYYNADENTKAVFWFKKAAQQRYSMAISNLAHFYREGVGLEKSQIIAAACELLANELKNGSTLLNAAAIHTAFAENNSSEQTLYHLLYAFNDTQKINSIFATYSAEVSSAILKNPDVQRWREAVPLFKWLLMEEK